MIKIVLKIGNILTQLFNFKHYDILNRQVGVIANQSIKYFATFGEWHSYELLLYLLSFMGKCYVIITTFGLSEEGIRALDKAKKAGYIEKLVIIINTSSNRYKLSLLNFLKNIADEIYQVNIHAKIFYLKNEKRELIVNQSANFSRNSTFETGYVSSEIDVVNFYYNNLDTLIQKSYKLK